MVAVVVDATKKNCFFAVASDFVSRINRDMLSVKRYEELRKRTKDSAEM